MRPFSPKFRAHSLPSLVNILVHCFRKNLVQYLGLKAPRICRISCETVLGSHPYVATENRHAHRTRTLILKRFIAYPLKDIAKTSHSVLTVCHIFLYLLGRRDKSHLVLTLCDLLLFVLGRRNKSHVVLAVCDLLLYILGRRDESHLVLSICDLLCRRSQWCPESSRRPANLPDLDAYQLSFNTELILFMPTSDIDIMWLLEATVTPVTLLYTQL